MAIEDNFPSVGGSPDVARIPRYVSTIAWLVAVTGVVLAWLAIWGVVIRLHVLKGDFLSAGLVVGFFVIPAFVVVALYLRDSLTLE